MYPCKCTQLPKQLSRCKAERGSGWGNVEEGTGHLGVILTWKPMHKGYSTPVPSVSFPAQPGGEEVGQMSSKAQSSQGFSECNPRSGMRGGRREELRGLEAAQRCSLPAPGNMEQPCPYWLLHQLGFLPPISSDQRNHPGPSPGL